MMHVTDNDDMPHGRYCFCHFGFVLIHHFIRDRSVRYAFYAIICVAIFKKGLHQLTHHLSRSHTHTFHGLRATFTQSHQLVKMLLVALFWRQTVEMRLIYTSSCHLTVNTHTHTHTLFDINTKIETSIPLECLCMCDLQHSLYGIANSAFFCRHSLIWIIKIVITLLHISIWWWIMNGNG